MCGEVPASGLFGLDQLLSDAGVAVPEKVKRAVIVGTARSPVNPIETPDGLTIRTTWGDLAYQLGGTDGYALVAENDRTGISPGSELLSRLFAANAPCLILIDEWVAYLRHLYKADGLPAGSFDTNLSFVQALTEAVKVSPQTFLVASLPQSQIEVGGEGGEEAAHCRGEPLCGRKSFRRGASSRDFAGAALRVALPAQAWAACRGAFIVYATDLHA